MARTRRTAQGAVSRAVGVALIALAAALVPGTALATDTDCDGSERDAGNYVCRKSFIGGTPWIPDITADGTLITDAQWRPAGSLGVNSYRSITTGLAGGIFRFYGNNYSSTFSVGSNGYVMLGGNARDSVEDGSGFIPSLDLPNNAIYAYGDALDANSASGASVRYRNASGSTCNVDRNGDSLNDACVIVQWNNLPNQFDPDASVTVRLALNVATNEVIIEIVSEDEGLLDLQLPNIVGIENSTGTIALWYKNPVTEGTSSAAGTGDRFVFSYEPPDTTPPANVTRQTATSTDLNATPEFVPPLTDFAGVLVLRQVGSAVTDAPVSGQSYDVGDLIGSSDVVCKQPAPATSCTDSFVTVGSTYYYKTFAYDAALNYASGVGISAAPKAASVARFSVNVNVAALNAPSVAGSASGTDFINVVGNDRLAHRFNSSGLRAGWNPPVLGGAVQSRGSVGDIDPDGDGTVDLQAYFGAQNGFLYRVDMTNGTISSTNVASGAAGAADCAGLIQAGPAVMLDEYDANPNGNDNAVIVATRCGASDNQVLLYPLTLGAPQDRWPIGAEGSLGIVNASPLILYKDTANNIVFVAAREGGSGTLVGLEVDSAGTLAHPPYSVNSEMAGVDADPVFVDRGSEFWIAVGDIDGEVFLLDPNAAPGAGGPLPVRGSFTAADYTGGLDGPVKGLSATASLGGTNWIVWSTDTAVHGVPLQPDGSLDKTRYWRRDVSSPSPPLVLTGFTAEPRHRAFVGAGDGRLYQLDVLNATNPTSTFIQTGVQLGQPTFDYNNGAEQGLVVGTSVGTIHWVPLKNEN